MKTTLFKGANFTKENLDRRNGYLSCIAFLLLLVVVFFFFFVFCLFDYLCGAALMGSSQFNLALDWNKICLCLSVRSLSVLFLFCFYGGHMHSVVHTNVYKCTRTNLFTTIAYVNFYGGQTQFSSPHPLKCTRRNLVTTGDQSHCRINLN